jgi:hypothetical protein
MAYEWRKGDLEWARPKPYIPYLKDVLKVKVVENSSITGEDKPEEASLEKKD